MYVIEGHEQLMGYLLETDRGGGTDIDVVDPMSVFLLYYFFAVLGVQGRSSFSFIL